ncbi:right-handed parallel beta-helix repeat-containing protein [Halomarina ordinaria]|uniref:Right-handed parallel beta-helix repeat-containing protein n=1 Tax=Halomarina ordinaria TaxID=3033939 RepID=A0ABD5U8B8_9EURY|nr:right-handed parallel beta-helix repeat-containing protein [Halomarina sp. PSRA2]
MTPVTRPAFDRRQDAVADLGWDPTGGDPIALDPHVQTGTLIEVPPGTYCVPTGETAAVRASGVERFGLRGLGDDPEGVRFRPEDEGDAYILYLTDVRDVLLENYAVDYGERETSGALGHVVLADDDLQVRRLRKQGFTPSTSNGDKWFLFLAVEDPNGEGLVDDVEYSGPAEITGHGASRGFGGAFDRHQGTLTWRNLDVENNPGDGAPYVGTSGTNHMENCRWKNCALAAARNGGSDSSIRDSEITVDLDDQNPRNVGTYEAANPVYWDPQNSEEAGGVIENVTIRVEEPSDPNGAGYAGGSLPAWGIVVDSAGGNVTIENCDVTCNADRVPAVLAHAPEKRWDRAPPDPDEWGILLRETTIVGDGRLNEDDDLRNAAVVLERRPGSEVTDTTVDWPDAAYGVALVPWFDDRTEALVDDFGYDVGVAPIDDPAGNATVGNVYER